MADQDVFSKEGKSITFRDIKPTKLIIAELVVISLADGTTEFLPGYTPDAAAKAFWSAVSEDYRKMLKWKEEHGGNK